MAAGSKDKRKLVFSYGHILMALIGYYLKTSGHTNYFLIEMLLLVFPIMPIFIMTEKKLQKYDLETGGNDNEYFND
ncbi:hypothetical protein EfmAA290_17220 [Enterococcus faecium]|nr:hypothetical protein EfmAA290_17220 [Enterococcus faecium]